MRWVKVPQHKEQKEKMQKIRWDKSPQHQEEKKDAKNKMSESAPAS